MTTKTREYEIEIQIGRDSDAWETIYVPAGSEEAAIAMAKACASPQQRRWARFVCTGR